MNEKKYTSEKEGNLNEVRKVSFSKKDYIIKEIILNPNFSMDWIWNTGICPHCKNRLSKSINHEFYRLEIMIDSEKENITIDDLLIAGNTIDKRQMIIPKDKYSEILRKSENFKHLV